jgi:type III secretion protein T
MPDEFMVLVGGVAPESAILFLFIATLRPLGLLFGFMAFAWGMGTGVVLRTAVALSLGLPMACANVEQIIGVIKRNALAEMITILPKEVALGFALGFLASVPFFALKAAGAVTDNFRGESDSGHTDPNGGTISSWGIVFLLLGFFAFFASGGLWQLVIMLYESYAVWPLAAPLPPLSGASALRMADLVTTIMAQALLIAAPLLLLLIAVDFIVIIASRTAQRFKLYDNEFALKNLAAILALPLMVLYVARVTDNHVLDSLSALPILRGIVP